MIVKNEVEIHQNSVDYLNRIFEQYTEVEYIGKVSDPIIHIYPKQDTYEEDGELEGFIDALYSEVHIYDPNKLTVWKSKSLHDGIIPYSDLQVSQIKAFKDLSMMIALIGEYKISPFTAISIRKVD